MIEWKEAKIGEILELKNGKSRPEEDINGQIPIYGGNGILGWSNKSNSSGPINIIGRVGAYCGSVHFSNEDIWISDNAMMARAKEGYDEKFSFYLLKSLNLNQFAQGSGHPLLTQTLLNDIDVNVPPKISIQRTIAEVLSSLDDKIDLLQRQNETLERLAQTIFRQCFVEKVENGKSGDLGDLIKLHYGKGLKKSLRSGEGYPVIGSSGIIGYHNEYLVEGPGIVIGRKGTLGEVTYLFNSFHPIDTTYYIESKNNLEGLYFEYFLLKSMGFERMNTDSAVPGLNRDHALSSEVNIPSLKKIRQFNNVVKGFFQKIKFNNQQIETLEKQRDTLLPKLVTGDITIS